jgi:RNA polymerase sigma factor (sigma-70 family)
MDDTRGDAELLRAALRDPEAFGPVYRRHVAGLTRFALSRTGRADVAADIVAETFAAALEGLHRFDPERGDAGGWLHGIARHQIARWGRYGAVESRARRRLGVPISALEDEALEEVERLAGLDVAVVSVRHGLAELPADERSAVEARVVLGRDYGDIAREATVSEAVIRKRVSRGLARLRTSMGRERA